jgi:hypothetical protein
MEEAWSVPDVFLLSAGPEGEVAVPHLTLTFLDTGLALAKADGETVWDGEWTELEEMSPVGRSVLPDGRHGVIMLVVDRGRRGGQSRHRFVLATEDTAGLEAAVRARAAAHGLRTRSERRAVSRVLTVGIVLATLATIAALLLSATHVIHF